MRERRYWTLSLCVFSGRLPQRNATWLLKRTLLGACSCFAVLEAVFLHM